MHPADSGVADGVDTVAALASVHGLELVRFAYLLCGDRGLAEDLVQDMLVQLHQRFPQRLTVAHPFGYARRALVNVSIDRSRRASSRELPAAFVMDGAVVDGAGTPGAVLTGAALGNATVAAHGDGTQRLADRDELWQALRRLPERQRAVIVLRYYGDLSDAEIASALGCRRGTVRSLASRAVAAMRETVRPGSDRPAGGAR